jgi:hypothetical protein
MSAIDDLGGRSDDTIGRIIYEENLGTSKAERLETRAARRAELSQRRNAYAADGL